MKKIGLVMLLLFIAGCLTATATATQHHIPGEESEVPRITSEDLKARLDKGEAILIVDVRSVKEFEAKHIAGAKLVPLEQIKSRLDEFPRDREIVIYCA